MDMDCFVYIAALFLASKPSIQVDNVDMHTSAHTSLRAHTSAHTNLVAQMSAHMSLGAHTSVHTNALMRVFFVPGSYMSPGQGILQARRSNEANPMEFGTREKKVMSACSICIF